MIALLLAAATMKLCSPSGVIVSYSLTCPAGTTLVQKICPYGQIVPYSTACPTSPPPPITYGSKVTAVEACISYGNGKVLTKGKVYTVMGKWGFSPLDQLGRAPAGKPDGYLVLDDDGTKQDGANAWHIAESCVR